MNSQTLASIAGTNGESSAGDLFVLSDEQILDIAPEAKVGDGNSGGSSEPASLSANRNVAAAVTTDQVAAVRYQPTEQANSAQPEVAVPLEPPAWLAAQMQDPWGGEEARKFWGGVQQARSEAAA